MKDLRAEYREKSKAAEEQEDQFRRNQCNECGIWSLCGHLTKSGNCKYLILSKVEVDYNYDRFENRSISLPLSPTVTNAGCMLIDKSKQE